MHIGGLLSWGTEWPSLARRKDVAQKTDPDYTSLVPHYTFADTLEQQEVQLAENPLLQRMNEARRKMDGDSHRPLYHYVNPENRLNDPNGLCFW